VTLKNPYWTAGTLEGKAYIERDADQRLRKELLDNQRFVFLFGPRHSGTSSLITHCMDSLSPGQYCCTRVDLSRLPHSDYHMMIGALLETIANDTALDKQEILTEFPEDTILSWLGTFPQRLILFLDEAQILGPLPFRDQIFGKLRFLFNVRVENEQFTRLQVVLSGAAHPERLIPFNLSTPFVGGAIAVPALTLKQVEKLTWDLETAQVQIDGQVASMLFQQTSGVVHLCQVILQSLWEEAQKTHSNISIADVERVTDRLVASAEEVPHFRTIQHAVADDPTLLGAFLRFVKGDPIDPGLLQDLGLTGLCDPERPYLCPMYERVFGPNGPLDLGLARLRHSQVTHRLAGDLLHSQTTPEVHIDPPREARREHSLVTKLPFPPSAATPPLEGLPEPPAPLPLPLPGVAALPGLAFSPVQAAAAAEPVELPPAELPELELPEMPEGPREAEAQESAEGAGSSELPAGLEAMEGLAVPEGLELPGASIEGEALGSSDFLELAEPGASAEALAAIEVSSAPDGLTAPGALGASAGLGSSDGLGAPEALAALAELESQQAGQSADGLSRATPLGHLTPQAPGSSGEEPTVQTLPEPPPPAPVDPASESSGDLIEIDQTQEEEPTWVEDPVKKMTNQLAAARAAAEQASASPSANSKIAEVRGKLDAKLMLSAELDSFCASFFPHVAQKFVPGMSRGEKTELLVSLVAASEISKRLREWSSRLELHQEVVSAVVSRGSLPSGEPAPGQRSSKSPPRADEARPPLSPAASASPAAPAAEEPAGYKPPGNALQVGVGLVLANRYFLTSEVGQGAVAVVWSAYDRIKDEQVALKLLHGPAAENPAVLEVFWRSAQQMSALSHPAIVGVLNKPREENEIHYVVVEFLPGGNLRQWVLGGKLSRGQILRVLQRLGAGLQYAHERRVLHRNIKPTNVLFDGTGHARLTDFNVVWPPDVAINAETRSDRLIYMAPEEQLGGGTGDPRADVYSLGMCALFALFGQELPSRVVQERGSFIDHLDASPALKAVLRRATAASPFDRFATAAEFCRALEFDSPSLPGISLRNSLPIGGSLTKTDRSGPNDLHAALPQVSPQPAPPLPMSSSSLPPPIPNVPFGAPPPPLPVSQVLSSPPVPAGMPRPMALPQEPVALPFSLRRDPDSGEIPPMPGRNPLGIAEYRVETEKVRAMAAAQAGQPQGVRPASRWSRSWQPFAVAGIAALTIAGGSIGYFVGEKKAGPPNPPIATGPGSGSESLNRQPVAVSRPLRVEPLLPPSEPTPPPKQVPEATAEPTALTGAKTAEKAAGVKKPGPVAVATAIPPTKGIGKLAPHEPPQLPSSKPAVAVVAVAEKPVGKPVAKPVAKPVEPEPRPAKTAVAVATATKPVIKPAQKPMIVAMAGAGKSRGKESDRLNLNHAMATQSKLAAGGDSQHAKAAATPYRVPVADSPRPAYATSAPRPAYTVPEYTNPAPRPAYTAPAAYSNPAPRPAYTASAAYSNPAPRPAYTAPTPHPATSSAPAAASSSDGEAALTAAQGAFVRGQHQQAILMAMQVTTRGGVEGLKAWRFVGGAACSIRSAQLATNAYNHLREPEHRRLLVELCRRNGLQFNGSQFLSQED
jgi:serine/threonine protein kinase